MNGTLSTSTSRSLRQTSGINHYSYHMNGDLEDGSTYNESMTETDTSSTVPSVHIDRDGEFMPAVNGKPVGSEVNAEHHTLKPATFGLSRNGYIAQSDSDDNGEEDPGKLDDMYNFELSEDQKQTVRELFNLKIDLGFAADDDNRSGMYNLSERVQQLNEELAKEAPLQDPKPAELMVTFKENVVDFISPTPEPEWDSEEDGPMPENVPQQTDATEQDKNQLPDQTSTQSETSSTVSPISAPLDCSSESPTATPHVSESQSTQSSQDSEPTSRDEGRTDGKKFVKSASQTDAEALPVDDSRKKPAGEASGLVSSQIVDYRGVPMRPQSTKSMRESEDLALIECSGKYRMMSVSELTALQRRSTSSLSPGQSARSPRSPLSPSYLRSSSLPLPPARCQSARSQSSERLATERCALGEERRRRREEAEAGFQLWLARKKREAAEKRQRELEERQKNPPTEEEDPEQTQRAFEAWLRDKAKQRRAERRLHKTETSTETDDDPERSRVTFQQWLHCKTKQRRSERRLHKAEQLYLNEGVVVHRPGDCKRAFNRWVRGKNRELRNEQEAEQQRATISALAARKSKKSRALAHAMTHALRYTSDNGRR